MASQETPGKKWTPQRVPDTRHRPMSAMASINEVVQKELFFDDGHDQSTDVTDKDPGTQAEQHPVHTLTTESHCEQTVEISGTRGDKDKKEEQEQRIVGGQPLFQAPHRESVIFFSTGKKLLRAPQEKQECSAHLEQLGTEGEALRVKEETQCGSEPTWHINPSVLSLLRDPIVQKSSAVSHAVALLGKRLPPLEEVRLDEEVATYTSVSVPVRPAFKPPRPRCRNPLATILLFQESTRFTPNSSDPSSGPDSGRLGGRTAPLSWQVSHAASKLVSLPGFQEHASSNPD